MKPSRNAPPGMEDLFRSRLENIIDLRYELVRLPSASTAPCVSTAQMETFFSDASKTT
jgi:hypothetical protein